MKHFEFFTYLADHGMTNLKPERLVVLEKYLDMRNDVIRIPQYGNLVGILPKPDRTKVILQKLSNVPGIKCYEKDAFPESFHYKHNDRVMPIVCTPELGGYIVRVSIFNFHRYIKVKLSYILCDY